MKIKKTYFLSPFTIFLTLAYSNISHASLEVDWQNPPMEFKSKPFLEWSGRRPLTINKKGLTEIIKNSRLNSNYGGMTVVPDRQMQPKFMSKEYLDLYGHYLDTLDKYGMEAILYDDKGFPSGKADGAVPIEDRARQINLHATDMVGPAVYTKKLPEGHIIGIVAMNLETKKRWVISDGIKDGKLDVFIPAGHHKIMVFTTTYESQFKPLVNWLDPEASKRWLDLSLEKYHKNFADHFGTTIKTIFFDDLSFTQDYPPQNNRLWVDNYNQKFEKQYGFNPLEYYPAMWFDIGEETAWARNVLFGFRATLMSEGFLKIEQEWAHKHGLKTAGHFSQHFNDNNYIHFIGDWMKNFKYVDYPGLDEILRYRISAKKYKIVTSATTNYDREKTFVEVFGIYPHDTHPDILYKMVMEQFTKGITRFIPHAIWFEHDNILFSDENELSWRNPLYADMLSEWNDYIARTARVLEGGRTISDIAMLYPIAGIWGGIHFDKAETWPEWADWRPAEIDYLDVGENVFTKLRHEFTFIHPEVFDEKVTIKTENKADSANLLLNNKTHWQQYKVFVMPGSSTISLSNLQKVHDFWQAGGQVIATRLLPFRAVEQGKDQAVQKLVQKIFAVNPMQKYQTANNKSAKGGLAVFVQNSSSDEFKQTLNAMIPVHDVAFTDYPTVEGGPLTYTHKIVNGKNVYYFANASDKAIETPVQLRGTLKNPQFWNPHSGERNSIKNTKMTKVAAQNTTQVMLNIPASRSIFIIADL